MTLSFATLYLDRQLFTFISMMNAVLSVIVYLVFPTFLVLRFAVCKSNCNDSRVRNSCLPEHAICIALLFEKHMKALSLLQESAICKFLNRDHFLECEDTNRALTIFTHVS
jgi:hypothetical protein